MLFAIAGAIGARVLIAIALFVPSADAPSNIAVRQPFFFDAYDMCPILLPIQRTTVSLPFSEPLDIEDTRVIPSALPLPRDTCPPLLPIQRISTTAPTTTPTNDLATSLGKCGYMLEVVVAEEIRVNVTVRVPTNNNSVNVHAPRTSAARLLHSPTHFNSWPENKILCCIIGLQSLVIAWLLVNTRKGIAHTDRTIKYHASVSVEKDSLVRTLRDQLADKEDKQSTLMSSTLATIQRIMAEFSLSESTFLDQETNETGVGNNLCRLVGWLITRIRDLELELATQTDLNASLMEDASDTEDELEALRYEGLSTELEVLHLGLKKEDLERRLLGLELQTELQRAEPELEDEMADDEPSLLYVVPAFDPDTEPTPMKPLPRSRFLALAMDDEVTSDCSSGDLSSASSVCSTESAPSVFDSTPSRPRKHAPWLRTRSDWTGSPRASPRTSSTSTPAKRPIWIP